MTELLCKGKRYTWSPACQAAFEELKRRLTTAPILTPPDESETFQVFCDASLNGLGGVLMQGRNIVAYTSRQLLGPDVVQEAEDKVKVIREHLKAAQSRHKANYEKSTMVLISKLVTWHT